MPNQIDIKYIAGFFDGDGHASISFTRKDKTAVKIEVGFCNNYEQVLVDIRSYFHNYGMIYSIKPKNRRRKESFRYKIWRMMEVKEILEEILPYLRIKRGQAELILRFIDSRLSHGYIRTPYTQSELRMVGELKEKHKELRGKGIYGRSWKNK